MPMRKRRVRVADRAPPKYHWCFCGERNEGRLARRSSEPQLQRRRERAHLLRLPVLDKARRGAAARMKAALSGKWRSCHVVLMSQCRRIGELNVRGADCSWYSHLREAKIKLCARAVLGRKEDSQSFERDEDGEDGAPKDGLSPA